jgi:serine/threonine protein phosphatase 1
MARSWFARKRTREPGRRFVVGDIHGCVETFRALAERQLAVRGGDTLYLLGDLISKGPDSRSVLAYVLSLGERGIHVELIRGNHEDDLIRYRGKSAGKLVAYLNRTGNESLLDPENEGHLVPEWDRIVSAARYYIALPDALLSHAGFDFSAKNPFKETSAMVSCKSCGYDAEIAEGRPVIHGHIPTPLSTILKTIASHGPVIPLDNRVVGASSSVSYKIAEYGNLCALDIDRWELHVQPNIDHVTPEIDRHYSFCVQFPSLDGTPRDR